METQARLAIFLASKKRNARLRWKRIFFRPGEPLTSWLLLVTLPQFQQLSAYWVSISRAPPVLVIGPDQTMGTAIWVSATKQKLKPSKERKTRTELPTYLIIRKCVAGTPFWSVSRSLPDYKICREFCSGFSFYGGLFGCWNSCLCSYGLVLWPTLL